MEHMRLQDKVFLAATRQMTEFYERKERTGLGPAQRESSGGRHRRYHKTTITEIAENFPNRSRGRGTHENGEGK